MNKPLEIIEFEIDKVLCDISTISQKLDAYTHEEQLYSATLEKISSISRKLERIGIRNDKHLQMFKTLSEIQHRIIMTLICEKYDLRKSEFDSMFETLKFSCDLNIIERYDFLFGERMAILANDKYQINENDSEPLKTLKEIIRSLAIYRKTPVELTNICIGILTD